MERAQTVEELHAEIESIVPVTTPCEGSEFPWKHSPQRIIDGVTRVHGIRCTCGRVFEGKPWQAPSNQPAPELWAAFRAFKAHYQEISQ